MVNSVRLTQRFNAPWIWSFNNNACSFVVGVPLVMESSKFDIVTEDWFSFECWTFSKICCCAFNLEVFSVTRWTTSDFNFWFSNLSSAICSASVFLDLGGSIFNDNSYNPSIDGGSIYFMRINKYTFCIELYFEYTWYKYCFTFILFSISVKYFDVSIWCNSITLSATNLILSKLIIACLSSSYIWFPSKDKLKSLKYTAIWYVSKLF